MESFWRLIAQENVTLILCVCKLEEKGWPKCHQYWPSGDKDSQFNRLMAGSGIAVKAIGESKEGSHLVKRMFIITKADGSTQTVTQYHYLGWPDHYTPTDDSLNQFALVLQHLITHLATTPAGERALVHCSAGIGRTGTTIALANIILQIAAQANQGVKDPQFSVFSTVRRLREQRFLMVQMEEQYLFIHDFLETWLTQSEDALALLGGKAA